MSFRYYSLPTYIHINAYNYRDTLPLLIRVSPKSPAVQFPPANSNHSTTSFPESRAPSALA